jgi:hypothetical protein
VWLDGHSGRDGVNHLRRRGEKSQSHSQKGRHIRVAGLQPLLDPAVWRTAAMDRISNQTGQVPCEQFEERTTH